MTKSKKEDIVSEIPLDVSEQDGIKNPIYIPDMPAQMIEQPTE